MGHTNLGMLGSAQAKASGTALTITNSSGAAIPVGTVLVLSFVTDNPASVTTPTLTLSAYTGGGSWATNKVTSVGVTSTAGTGIHHFSTWVKTTTSIASGATIVTATLSASTVAKAAQVVGFSGIFSLKNSGTSTQVSGSGSPTGLGITNIAVGDVLIEVWGQEAATFTPDSNTTNGTWSTALTFGTSGSTAQTNVVTAEQDKDSTGAGNWASTFANLSADQSVHGYVFNPILAPPVAAAGTDQTVQRGSAVSLVGTGSTAAAGISTYAWSQLTGTAVTLTNANTATATFTAPSVTSAVTLTFRLTVTDNQGQTNTDDISVLVRSNPPVAAAGTDQSVASNVTVNLSGTGSTDDGGVTGYSWAQIAGTPTVSLTGATTSTPSFTSPATSATLTFRLTVTDVDGQTSTDDIIVTVTAAANTPPVANAGADQVVTAGATVNLSGTASSDDVGISSWLWEHMGSGIQYVDDFNRADGALGSNWITSSATPATISNRKVIGSSAATHGARYANVLSSDDQFSEATYQGGLFVDVSLQMPAYADGVGPTITGSWYLFRVVSAGQIAISSKDIASGSVTNLQTAVYSISAGDVMRLEYVSGVLTAYINGVQKIQTTPSNPLKGNPCVGWGIMSASYSGVDLLDNWSGGEIVTSPGAITISGSTTSSASFTAPSTPGVYSFKLTVTDAGGLTSTDTVQITVPAPAVASVVQRGIWVSTAPNSTITNGVPFDVTLPVHISGDRLVVIEVGKYSTASMPLNVTSGWTVVGSGLFATGQTNGTDTGTLHWQIIAKDATSNAETLQLTPAGTPPNSAITFAGAFPAPSTGWMDSIASMLKSALVDTVTTGVLASSPAAFGSSPAAGDMIIAVGAVPTDSATAAGTVTLTNAGLSGGTVAASNFQMNQLGTDMAAALAEWTGFTGTESGAYSASFDMTGASAMYGGIVLAALRANPATAAAFEGWGIPI